MKFKEWLEKFNKQSELMRNKSLGEVVETLDIDNCSIVIKLSANGEHCEVDSNSVWLKRLRPYYTKHKEEFDAILESITTQVQKITSASEDVMNILTEHTVPEAVMNRMKGDDEGDTSSSGMVRSVLNNYLQKIGENTTRKLSHTIFGAFTCGLGEVAGYPMTISYSNANTSITWGNHITMNGRVANNGGIEEAVMLLSNIDVAEGKLNHLCEMIKAVKF